MTLARIEAGGRMVEYDPTGQVSIEGPVGCVVVVIRDPDWSNAYRAWTRRGKHGLLYAVDIDAGADDLKDASCYRDWADGFGHVADGLEAAGWSQAADYVRDTVKGYDPEEAEG